MFANRGRILDRFSWGSVVFLFGLNVLASLVLNMTVVQPRFGAIAATLANLSPFLLSVWLARFCSLERCSKALKRGLALAVTLLSALTCLLLLYHAQRRFPFDFSYFWFNRGAAFETLTALGWNVGYVLPSLTLALWLHYRGLLQRYEGLPEKSCLRALGSLNRQPLIAFIAGCGIMTGLAVGVDNELKTFIRGLLKTPSAASKIYTSFYDEAVRRNKSNAIAAIRAGDQRNLILLHLESLNADLVNRLYTPNLLQIAEAHGVFFPRMQSASVLTIREQETLLCGLLPALRENIAMSRSRSAGLVCLPRILKNNGYRTLYFQSYPNLTFANRDMFMREIGFDELHSEDIMKPGDQLLRWGYADDIFYQRVFEFLATLKEQKFLAYIGAHATNHYPFYDEQQKNAYPELRAHVPFPNAARQKEKMANSTYLQDQFFGAMYRDRFVKKFAADTDMVVFGDHSWPTGVQPGNEYNENWAYQDNFVTAMAILPATKHLGGFRIGKKVEQLRGHLDLVPTLLEAYGIANFSSFGKSFLKDATENSAAYDRCLVSVQPFGGGYIAVVDYPIKYIYQLSDESLTTYDLQKDPRESAPSNRRPIDKAGLRVLEDCLASLSH